MTTRGSTTSMRGGSYLRLGVWALHVALPLLGLWGLLARPQLDLRWEHHASHFALVGGVGAVAFAIGWAVGVAAREHADARLTLVSLTFLSSAGFLLLHGVTTPNVLLDGPNLGFSIAAPLGLCIGGVFAAVSSLELSPARARAVLRAGPALQWLLVAVLVGWIGASWAGIASLDAPLEAAQLPLVLGILAIVGIPLYLFAAVLMYRRYRQRPAVLLVSLITAYVVLAEALLTSALGRNWQASWWLWHVLMAVGFVFVGYSALVQYGREGSGTGLFSAIGLRETVRRLEDEYRHALDALVGQLERTPPHEDAVEVAEQLAARLPERFRLTPAQAEVLGRAGVALADERAQSARLRGLVGAGRATRVIVDEATLLDRMLEEAGPAFAGLELFVQLGPPPDGQAQGLRLDLTVKGKPAGALVARGRAVTESERWALEALASQMSVGLENARLYEQISSLFHRYMSPDVATTLLADPTAAGLGGKIADVTVLFADLRGFTPFSERSGPDEVVAMLNRYFGAAVPAVLDEGGTVVQFVGDALMAIFNAPTRQPDHALRAARAALALQRAADEITAEHPDWPRFRVGVNTGPALVGNIGGEQVRNYTAIGDTTNTAARLEALAEEGTVVIGGSTRAALGAAAQVESLGPLTVKGRTEAVEAFVLKGLTTEVTPKEVTQ